MLTFMFIFIFVLHLRSSETNTCQETFPVDLLTVFCYGFPYGDDGMQPYLTRIFFLSKYTVVSLLKTVFLSFLRELKLSFKNVRLTTGSTVAVCLCSSLQFKPVSVTPNNSL